MIGFCAVEVKLFGPLQVNVAPPIFVAVRNKVSPAHTGLFAPAVGAAAALLTATSTVAVALVQPLTVT